MTNFFSNNDGGIQLANCVKLLAVMLAVFFAPHVGAQTPAPRVTLEHTAQHSLASKATGRTYEVMVSLPRDYDALGKAYPVLYALDGWHFPFLNFMQNNSTSLTRRMPPVIIVVIGHGHPPKLNEVREQDFLGPTSQPKGTSGHAEKFLEFLETELIPFIDRQYRTVSSDRALLGHSYGGGFAIYALAERPTLFQRIVCVSPSFASTREKIFDRLREQIDKLSSPVVLDISVGTEGDLTEEAVALAFFFDSIKPGNLRRRLTVYNGENHDSVRLSAFPAGLQWVYR